jgi:hypothetical protein
LRVAVGKIGKSIQFRASGGGRVDKQMTSGGIDARLLFETLILSNPNDTFVIAGRSNYYRLSPEDRADLNRHGNVEDFWDGFKAFEKKHPEPEADIEARYVEHRLKTMEPVDSGVFLAGGTTHLSVGGRIVNKHGELAKMLMASKIYQGSLHHFINETKLPYVLLVTDPRCFPEPFGDVFVMPAKVLSQYEEEVVVPHRTSYAGQDEIEEVVKTEYRGIETLYVMEDVSKRKKSVESFFDESPKRDIEMALFLNEGRPSRYRDVVDFVFPACPNAKVYGSWSDKVLADPRFEATPMSQLTHLFDRIKYTFCVPIKRGWATGKFWEMTSFGIVPFVHPEYDVQRNIGFPEWLRVSSPLELREKIDMLEAHPQRYDALWKVLNEVVTDEHRSGRHLNRVVMEAAREVVR